MKSNPKRIAMKPIDEPTTRISIVSQESHLENNFCHFEKVIIFLVLKKFRLLTFFWVLKLSEECYPVCILRVTFEKWFCHYPLDGSWASSTWTRKFSKILGNNFMKMFNHLSFQENFTGKLYKFHRDFEMYAIVSLGPFFFFFVGLVKCHNIDAFAFKMFLL